MPQPSAEHPPDGIELLGKTDVFLRIECLDLPEYLEKELEEIKPRRCFLDIRRLLCFPYIPRNEDRFAGFEKQRVDLGAEGIAGILGDMRDEVMP